jgi:DNA repair protein RadC
LVKKIKAALRKKRKFLNWNGESCARALTFDKIYATIEKEKKKDIGIMGEHSGHRHRICERLKNGGVFEHELLEILLFNAIPRRNTNDIAHRLLARFGTIGEIFNADMDELQTVAGVGESVAAYLHVVGRFYESYAEERNEGVTVLPVSFEAMEFSQFVKASYENRKTETLDFYLLDKGGKIFGLRKFSGMKNFVEIEPESFTNMLIKDKPAGLIAVHNHPNGSAKPSKADDELTAKCVMMCSFHNILFCDHIVYGSGEVFSYYQSGQLGGISKNCTWEMFGKIKSE